MLPNTKIYRIYSHYEDAKDLIRPGYTEEEVKSEVEDIVLNTLVFDNDVYINTCLIKDQIFIRDYGHNAKKVFDELNVYMFMEIEEVSYDVIIENSYLKDNGLLYEDGDPYNEHILHVFNEFRKELTSIDDVLDKISEKGIDYIDDIDKEILKTKNPS